jgi:hypothetical protein
MQELFTGRIDARCYRVMADSRFLRPELKHKGQRMTIPTRLFRGP